MNLNSTKRHLPKCKVQSCDCGQPAYKRDGSGWFCKACEVVVQLAQTSLDERIRKCRREENARRYEDNRREYASRYQQLNAKTLREYQHKYRLRIQA